MPRGDSDLPVRLFASVAEWDAWLSAESRASKGLWLKFAKKNAGTASISRQDAIDTALCHGWIDGQLAAFDDDYWLIRFTPRKAKSKWSEINRNRALTLIEQGRMMPAGLEEIERAKADGRWDTAYASQSTATIPDDLKIALDGNPDAKNLFDELDSTNRYAILHRVHDAKKPETRAGRIEKYVAMLGRGETIYPRKEKSARGQG